MNEMERQLDFFAEPLLEFGFGQQATNPKAGLYFYGPLEEIGRPKHIKVGVLGTPSGVSLYRQWAEAINYYVAPAASDSLNHLPFPGFNALLSTTIGMKPEREVVLQPTQLASAIRRGRRHEAVRETVAIYEDAIRRNSDEDLALDVWIAIIPDEIYRYGRPQSTIPKDEAVRSRLGISRRRAAEILSGAPSLFAEENLAAETFLFEPNFRHQLKAKLLDNRTIVLQILRESTLETLVKKDAALHKRRLQDPATIAWNLSTTLFFKAGGHPWKLANVRPRVCYVGLVFKLFPDSVGDNHKACCGAQMFLDSGDGLIFRGTPGNYYNPKTKQYHLSEAEAKSLVERVVAAFKTRDKDDLPPTELVIHGRTRFNSEELRGFSLGAPESRITAVRIIDSQELKLYTPRNTPVLRGTGLRLDERRGYIWTKGFIPEIGTYPGREVPKPLYVEIVDGKTDLPTVLQDLLMLTKLNFNSCIFADGLPVTLRFADAIGDIITAIPESVSARPNVPLPFKHYI